MTCFLSGCFAFIPFIWLCSYSNYLLSKINICEDFQLFGECFIKMGAMAR